MRRPKGAVPLPVNQARPLFRGDRRRRRASRTQAGQATPHEPALKPPNRQHREPKRQCATELFTSRGNIGRHYVHFGTIGCKTTRDTASAPSSADSPQARSGAVATILLSPPPFEPLRPHSANLPAAERHIRGRRSAEDGCGRSRRDTSRTIFSLGNHLAQTGAADRAAADGQHRNRACRSHRPGSTGAENRVRSRPPPGTPGLFRRARRRVAEVRPVCGDAAANAVLFGVPGRAVPCCRPPPARETLRCTSSVTRPHVAPARAYLLGFIRRSYRSLPRQGETTPADRGYMRKPVVHPADSELPGGHVATAASH